MANLDITRLSPLFTISFPSSSAVTIGFDAAAYNVTETDGSVSVGVSVRDSTTLARDVVVTVQTAGGTATGETLMYDTHFVDVLFMFIISPSSYK